MTVEELVESRGPALLRLAHMLTGATADAEDLFQSMIVRLLQHRERFERADQPGAYARRVLLNEFISAGRKPWRREVSVDHLPEQRHTDPVRASTDDEAWQLLMGLPRQQRAVLALRYYEDLSDPEIAATLDISPSTVRSNAARGLATLRTALFIAPKESRR